MVEKEPDFWNDDYWNGEHWLLFSRAAAEIEDKLGVSLGVAERTLRELCAKGDIRSIRGTDEDLAEEEYAEEPTFIKPSEWLSLQVDFDGKYYNYVRVSEDDLRYWLASSKPHKAVGKKPRILTLLAEMFPKGVPDPARCPRKALKADLLTRDPGLEPLDEATLKSAIDAYNADPKRS
jgi:hypothetical protein